MKNTMTDERGRGATFFRNIPHMMVLSSLTRPLQDVSQYTTMDGE